MATDLPDGELIAGSVANPAMFADIFDRHDGELYRYLRRQVGADLAADLAADTFVTAFARHGSYRVQAETRAPGDNLCGGTVSFYVDVGENGIYSGALEPLCTHAELTYNAAAHDNVATCSCTPGSAQTDQFSAEYAGYGERSLALLRTSR